MSIERKSNIEQMGLSPEEFESSEELLEFNSKRLIEEETGLFDKLRGKARKVSEILLLITAFSVGTGIVREAGAQEKESIEIKQIEEQQKKDVSITGETLWLVVEIMKQAREELKQKFPGDNNATKIDMLGSSVVTMFEKLPNDLIIKFKGDDTIEADYSGLSDDEKQTKHDFSGTDKESVANMRSQIGSILKTGGSMEEKKQAIINFWLNSEKGKALNMSTEGEPLDEPSLDKPKEEAEKDTTKEEGWEKVEPTASSIDELIELAKQNKYIKVSEDGKEILITSRYAPSERGAIQDAQLTALTNLGQHPQQNYEIKKFIYRPNNNAFEDITGKTSYKIPEGGKVLYQVTIKDSVENYINK